MNCAENVSAKQIYKFGLFMYKKQKQMKENKRKLNQPNCIRNGISLNFQLKHEKERYNKN